MADCILELNHELALPREEVSGYLLDFKKFAALHPYMTSVEIIDRQPGFTEYKIREEIYFFGFIKNYPQYTAKVFEVEKNTHIRYTSPVKSFIQLTVDFYLSERNGKTSIKEIVCVECHRFIGNFFLGILKKAHLAVFERMKQIKQS